MVIQIDMLHRARLQITILCQCPEIQVIQLERICLFASQGPHVISIHSAHAADLDESAEIERNLSFVDALDVG